MTSEFEVKLDDKEYTCTMDAKITKDDYTPSYWLDVNEFKAFEFNSGKEVSNTEILARLEKVTEELFTEKWFADEE